MTQKELNYLEDAISHEDNVIKILTSILDYLMVKLLNVNLIKLIL